MYTRIFNFLFLVILLFCGCTPSTSYYYWTSPEHDYKKFNRVSVFGITRDLQDASDFETAMVKQFQKMDYSAIPGMAVIPPEWMKDLDVKSIRKHLLSKGIEGVLSLAIVNVDTRKIYTSGSVYSVPTQRQRFGSNYLTTYQDIYTPGYYSEASTYIYEAHFYDLTLDNIEQNLIWSFQYKYDSSTPGIPQLSGFTRTLIQALQRDQIL